MARPLKTMLIYCAVLTFCALFISARPAESNSDTAFQLLLSRAKVEKSPTICLEALSYAQSHGLLREEADALFYLGYLQYEDGDFHNSILNYFSSLEIAKALNYDKRAGSCLKNIGIVYRASGDPISAINYYRDAKPYVVSIGKPEKLASLNLNIGRSWRMANNTDSARLYFHRALAHYEAANNYKYISRVYNEIGITYRIDSAYSMARKWYSLSMDIAEKVDSSYILYRKAHAFNNIGCSYLNEESDSSFFFFRRSMSISKNLSQVPNSLYSNLAQAFFISSNHQDSSRFYFEQSIKDFNSAEISEYYVDALEYLIKSYISIDPIKSKSYTSKLADATRNQINLSQKLQELNKQYQVKSATEKLEKERRNQQLVAEKRNAQVVNLALTTFGIILCIYLIMKIRRRRKAFSNHLSEIQFRM